MSAETGPGSAELHTVEGLDGWPDPCSLADEIEADEAFARDQAYWASPEGVERQLAEHRVEREKWGPIRD